MASQSWSAPDEAADWAVYPSQPDRSFPTADSRFDLFTVWQEHHLPGVRCLQPLLAGGTAEKCYFASYYAGYRSPASFAAWLRGQGASIMGEYAHLHSHQWAVPPAWKTRVRTPVLRDIGAVLYHLDERPSLRKILAGLAARPRPRFRVVNRAEYDAVAGRPPHSDAAGSAELSVHGTYLACIVQILAHHRVGPGDDCARRYVRNPNDPDGPFRVLGYDIEDWNRAFFTYIAFRASGVCRSRDFSAIPTPRVQTPDARAAHGIPWLRRALDTPAKTRDDAEQDRLDVVPRDDPATLVSRRLLGPADADRVHARLYASAPASVELEAVPGVDTPTTPSDAWWCLGVPFPASVGRDASLLAAREDSPVHGSLVVHHPGAPDRARLWAALQLLAARGPNREDDRGPMLLLCASPEEARRRHAELRRSCRPALRVVLLVVGDREGGPDVLGARGWDDHMRALSDGAGSQEEVYVASYETAVALFYRPIKPLDTPPQHEGLPIHDLATLRTRATLVSDSDDTDTEPDTEPHSGDSDGDDSDMEPDSDSDSDSDMEPDSDGWGPVDPRWCRSAVVLCEEPGYRPRFARVVCEDATLLAGASSPWRRALSVVQRLPACHLHLETAAAAVRGEDDYRRLLLVLARHANLPFTLTTRVCDKLGDTGADGLRAWDDTCVTHDEFYPLAGSHLGTCLDEHPERDEGGRVRTTGRTVLLRGEAARGAEVYELLWWYRTTYAGRDGAEPAWPRFWLLHPGVLALIGRFTFRGGAETGRQTSDRVLRGVLGMVQVARARPPAADAPVPTVCMEPPHDDPVACLERAVALCRRNRARGEATLVVTWETAAADRLAELLDEAGLALDVHVRGPDGSTLAYPPALLGARGVRGIMVGFPPLGHDPLVLVRVLGVLPGQWRILRVADPSHDLEERALSQSLADVFDRARPPRPPGHSSPYRVDLASVRHPALRRILAFELVRVHLGQPWSRATWCLLRSRGPEDFHSDWHEVRGRLYTAVARYILDFPGTWSPKVEERLASFCDVTPFTLYKRYRPKDAASKMSLDLALARFSNPSRVPLRLTAFLESPHDESIPDIT